MSANLPIDPSSNITAPTPQNTPLTNQAPIGGLSRPTVPDIAEGDEVEDDEDEAPSGALSSMQAAMLGLVQGRLANLVGKSSGYIESLPIETKRAVEGLKGVQVKQTELQNKYKRECLELEKKYLALAKPLYDRRHAVITGAAQVTPEEIEAGEQQSIKDDDEYKPISKDAFISENPSKGIPEFWLTALRNHIGLSEIITERDAEALKSLHDIRIEYLATDKPDEKPGFKLLFSFGPNAFFENEVLEKTYLYQEEIGYSGDFVYDRAIGTEIKWKDDKDLTKEVEIKKQRNKNTNRTRLVKKTRPAESFFNFFSPPSPPPEDPEEDVLDEDEFEELEEKLEMDYQLGEDFKEKIIPRAVDYFTGKALEFEMLEEDEDDFEDEDDEDEDAFDDDEDDSDGDVPARRRAPPKGRRGGGAGGTNPEECKQQ